MSILKHLFWCNFLPLPPPGKGWAIVPFDESFPVTLRMLPNALFFFFFLSGFLSNRMTNGESKIISNYEVIGRCGLLHSLIKVWYILSLGASLVLSEW